MLLNFSVKNWRSIADEIKFSMEPSEDTSYEEGKITTVERAQRDILNTSAIYGGNASGKSNFIAAINFVRQMVLGGRDDDTPFLLDPDYKNEKTSFMIEFLTIDDKVYRLEFSVHGGIVLEETLWVVAKSNGVKKLVYNRSKGKYNKKIKRLDLFWGAVVENKYKLALHGFLSCRVPYFRSIGSWFRNSLMIILPNMQDEWNHNVSDVSDIPSMNRFLRSLDLGLDRIGTQDLSELDSLRLKSQMTRGIKKGKKYILHKNDRSRMAFQFGFEDDGSLKIEQLIAIYTNTRGEDVPMPLEYESDGTWRVITLAPVFAELLRPNSHLVLVVDEFDRSLHTLLTRALIEKFQNFRSENARSQLIFTSHDVMLMDTSLLLLDGLWIIEKRNGKTTLFPLSDYEDLNAKEIQKDYLAGRLGGIPSILVAPFMQGEDVTNE